MIDFLTNLFKSEDEKLAEQYEEYKKKFPKHKLWRKGNGYIINGFTRHPNPKVKEPWEHKIPLENHNEIEAKAYYVKRCKEIEQNKKPLKEV